MSEKFEKLELNWEKPLEVPRRNYGNDLGRLI